MSRSGGARFSEWRSAAPGVWHLDRVHYAHPVPALYAALFPAGLRAGSAPAHRRYGLLTDGLSYQFVHGYGYAQAVLVEDPTELDHRRRQAEQTFAERRWRDDVRLWRTDVLPATIQRHVALGEVDPALLGDDLPAHLETCMTHFSAMVAQHHRFNPTVVVPVGDLVAHTCDWTGCAADEVFEALAGHSPVSRGVSPVAVDAARAVAHDAEARALLHADEEASEVLARLARSGGGVAGPVRQFLIHEGHRLVGGFDIGCPTALEAPQVLVAMLRRLAADGPVAPDTAAAALRRCVPGAHLARFDEMFEDAVLAFPLRDERGVYSDTWAGGILRRVVLALGARLASSGAVVDAEHVMEATPAEVMGLARGAGAPTAADLADRAAARAAAAIASPPPALGGPDASAASLDPAGLPPPLQRMWRATQPAAAVPRDAGSGITGVGVGTTGYSGPARVITDLGELWRVRPGDVLVVPAATESLNIVAPMLGALVTDFGRATSHAAITARECRIPAIVGCGDATKRIPDGCRVRIDPIAGEVVVLSGATDTGGEERQVGDGSAAR